MKPRINAVSDDAITKIAASNSLTDLAARIKAEHTAIGDSLRRGVEHAMAAGDLLVEAKAQLKHGEWLPWIRDHCAISDRTAQLYMRVAKNRVAIEEQAKSATVADLTLNEAAAVLMLTSDMNKILNFARDCEHLSGEELVERCIAEGVAVIHTPDYNMFSGRSDAEKLEWHLFTAFLSYDGDAHRDGGEPQRVWCHVEYLLQQQFQNVTELLGEKGNKYRKFYGMGEISEQYRTDWATFLDEHRDCTLADVENELRSLQLRFEQARKAGLLRSGASRKRGRAPP
jgi:hypothetical protein